MASDRPAEADLKCRCPLELTPGELCPDNFSEEDFLCALCREIHKPMFPEEWHIGDKVEQ